MYMYQPSRDNLTVRASVYRARLQSRFRLYIALVNFALTFFLGTLSLISQ